jgi:hypothetical protein
VPDAFLVLDTETTITADQRLLFGCWRYYRTRWVADNAIELSWVAEGLFYPDDLATWDPDGYEILRRFEHQRLAVDTRDLDANPRLSLQSQDEFLKRTLWIAANHARAGIAAFNFPFDLSRVARGAGETRHRLPRGDEPARARARRPSVLDGGFSLMLWPYAKDGRLVQSHYRPVLAIRNIDSKRAFKAFKAAERVDQADQAPDDPDSIDPSRPWKFRGHFLDVRTLVFALTDRGHNLESACDAFDVQYKKRKDKHGTITPEYVTYCREDTEATGQLLEAALNAFLRHPVPLQATRAYSPATIGKSYLRAMNIKPPLARRKIDPRVLGWSMSAYYGGRAECRIRKTPVPVVYCDFLSMYPTVCSLMGIWKLLTTRHVRIDQNATTEIQQRLDNLDTDACFDPPLWPQLVGIAQIKPDGDILPVRARYSGGQSWQIGINPLKSQEPLWYTIADLAASKILTCGKTPQILKAITLAPTLAAAVGLQPVNLLSEIPVDPTDPDADFFQLVVQERKRLETELGKDDPRARGLKVLANATSYGIYAEMTRHELPNRRRDEVTVYGSRDKPHTARINTPEDPGEFAFPPMAGAITGGARLMLALLERCITDQGGSYAFCDTDSMAVVATRTGGLIPCPGGPDQLDGADVVRALSYRQVDAIRDRFRGLNPYRGALAGESILELEDENYAKPETRRHRRQLHCYAISSKRYVLYNHESGRQLALRGHTAVDDDTDSPDQDEPALRKPSEHGLGQLLNPIDPDDESRDWIAESWQFILRGHAGRPDAEPDWLDRSAVARTAITSPRLRRQFRTLNRGKSYDHQIKPFNFLLVTFIDILERPADERHIVLIASYEANRNRWLGMCWTNRYSGRTYHLSLEPSEGRERVGIVTPKTYRDILNGYRAHEESKSLAASGVPCEPLTAGLLRRRPVVTRAVMHIGKEANHLEDTLAGLIVQEDERTNTYDDAAQRHFFDHVVPVLRERLGIRETARRTHMSVAAVHSVLAGGAYPRAANRQRYLAVAADLKRT